jgi:hypothetical protein
MKKIILSVALIISLGVANTSAQGLKNFLEERFSGGLKLEGNGTNFLLSDMSDTKSEIGFGGTFGGFIKIDLSENFAIQEDILFSYSSSKLKQNRVEDTYEYFGMEVPIYFMGQWKTASGGRFYGGVGPYFGVGFQAKLKDSDIDLYKKQDGNDPFLKRINFGGAAQMGYELSNGLQFNASYRIGANTLDAGKDDSKMLPQTISLGLGYKF